MTEIQLKSLIKVCVKSLNESLHGLKRKELKDIINLRYIHGVSTLDKVEASKKFRLEIYNFVLRKCPWILKYQYPSTHDGHWSQPFVHFFQSEAEGYEDWLGDFQTEILNQLNFFQHWINFNIKKDSPPYWLSRYKLAQNISEHYPTFEQDLKNLYEYVSLLRKKEPHNPINVENYPLFVSLYSVSREYGGPEEGGWHYPFTKFVKSIKVNNYKEARNAAVKLLKNMTSDFEGTIVALEKTEKSLQTRERPHYS